MLIRVLLQVGVSSSVRSATRGYHDSSAVALLKVDKPTAALWLEVLCLCLALPVNADVPVTAIVPLTARLPPTLILSLAVPALLTD